MRYDHYPGGYYDGNMMDGGTSLIGLLFMLIVIGFIIWAAIYITRTLGQNARLNSTNRDPIDIARERYAKGEITKEELADIKKELK